MLKPLFTTIDEQVYPKILFVSGFTTIILLTTLSLINLPLQNLIAPNGMISFELAADYNESQEMINSWNSKAKIYAAFSLGIDYLFLVAYGFFLSLLCVFLAHKVSARKIFYEAGILVSYGVLGAAMLDAIENFALFKLLLGSSNEFYSLLASSSAIIKFMLVLLSFVYILSAGIMIRVLKNHRT